MRYYVIEKDGSYYSHSRPFTQEFEPEFTRDQSNAKYFTDRSKASEILDKLTYIGIKGYEIKEFEV